MSKEIDTKQMSLLGDSHANHFQSQEKEKEQMTIDTSGMKLLESLENVNQNGSLAKMLKVLLTSKTAWYSDRCKLIWKKKVSKSNVLLFQLQASVLSTNVSEFGSSDIMYPTPTSQDHSRNTVPPSIGKTRGMDLSMRVVADQMRMYPTPTQDSASERTKKYKQGGTPLPMAVKMFPTPSASCQMDVVAPPETVKQNSKGWSVTRVGTGTKFGAKLNDVVNKIEKMYPTPMARDYKDVSFNTTWKLGNKAQPIMARTVIKNNKLGGKLNPTFVEFLMGYPMDWTKIEPTE